MSRKFNGTYPCAECIVKGNCTDMNGCEKTDDHRWRIDYVFADECCVDCGGTEALENPSNSINPSFIVCIECLSMYYRSSFKYLIKHNWKRENKIDTFTPTTFSKFIAKHDFNKGDN